jgi:ATP-binding cassette subfamily A (ABC1) protein 3
MPVPTFDQYVGTSLALSSLIGVDDLPRVFSDSAFGRQWGNLLTLGTLHLSPDNDVSRSFWGYLNETYPLLLDDDTLKVRVHENERDALQFIEGNLKERTWALVDFSGQSPTLVGVEEEEDFQFKIRMNYTTVPNTNEITNYVAIGLNRDYQMYYLSGFLTLQRTLNEFAFSRDNVCTDRKEELASLWSMPMPTAAYSQNPFFTQVGYLLGLTMVMAFLYPTSRLIKTIVEEKETRMKETLFILGLKGWAHWLSWLITSLVVYFIITITTTAVLTSNLFTHSDAGYIFAFIGLFSTATVGFCFTLAALFSRAKLAAIVGPIALFTTILPRFIFFGFNRYEATTGKMWASLLPATAFAFGADILGDYEYSEQGIQEWNASEGDYSFNTSLGFLFFDTILYTFLGWYFEQVIPRQYGVARPWYFLFTLRYWLSFCTTKKERSRSSGDVDGLVHPPASVESSNDVEEVTDPKLRARVQINNLVKQYKKNAPPAVDNFSLSLYESQITALLGHNGAGKTTAVSVLTGLFPPTSGDCVIYGKSIVDDMMEARHSLGICPQHNVLFDSLTVYEHLSFFQRMKGIRPTDVNVRDHAVQIGLGDYLRTTALALSGGNKRKLSVAIALSGDPDVLILDEPTSSMDPHSRRAVWELLRQKRKGRVTLLTTHFMDEAELLSDRIAVMKEGRLQCCGSALFLKERFGLGYNLTVVLETPPVSSDEEQGRCDPVENPLNSETFEAQRDRLTMFLQQHIPNTELLRTSGKELTFRFPQGSEEMFPAAFDELELARDSLHIGAYGVTNCSLEEVFLQLAQEEDATGGERPSEDAEAEKASETVLGGASVTREEYHHLSPFRQIGLLYTKRFIIQKRDWKGAFFAVILPVIVVALVLLVLMIEPPFVGPAIEVNPSLYRKSSSGTSGETNIPVGGGRGGDSTSRNADVATEYSSLSDTVHQHYKYTDFSYLENATSSDAISRYLLETYNDHDHHIRFGAYALEDSIDVALSFNWEALVEDTQVFGVLPLDDVNLIEILGLGDENGKIKRKLSVSDLATEFYNSTSLSPGTTFDAVSRRRDIAAVTKIAADTISHALSRNSQLALHDLTKRALDVIFASRPNPNLTTSADAWVDTVEDLLVEFTGELGRTFNETNEATNDTLVNLEDLFYDFLEENGSFDQVVIESEMEALLIGVIDSLQIETEIDIPDLIRSALEYLDLVVENSSLPNLSNVIAIAPIVITDAILLQVSAFGNYFGFLTGRGVNPSPRYLFLTYRLLSSTKIPP